MRVSLSWIKRLLDSPDLGMTPTELQAKLSLHVAEIEPQLERSGPALDGVVVGKVLTCAQHPNADKLRLTTVDVGAAAPLPIVCGAPNVAVGQTVAVATIGTTLSMKQADGTVKALTIKSAKLRGEPSEGMICAEDELGLGASHDGIMILPEGLKAGTSLSDALGVGDTVFVLENAAITHRPDLWGHLGWAREVAVITGKKTPQPPDISWQSRGDGWTAEIRDDGCMTYFGAVIEGVKNIPSPQWMQDHLNAVGVRPLGLLIDVTNYVMLELGEPMHAFDLRDIAGKRIEVRSARAGETFTTLDGKAHQLVVGDLLIADGEKALALAGIMGGQGSMVRDDTSSILLEGAIFRPERIRRTRQRTGLMTDSSARFEKGLYPELAPAALNRAIALIDQLIPSCRITHRFAAGAAAGEARAIPFSPNLVKRLIGIDVEPATQRGILDRLGFRVGDKVEVPWWRRKDVHASADLVEEVARHHGYHKIEPVIPRLAAEAPPMNEQRRAEHRARTLLSGAGWDEVQTYAFTSEAWIDTIGLDALKLIKLSHPLSSEQTVMRPNLVPTLAEALGRNRKHQDDVRIYEIGKRYRVGIGGRGRSDGCDDETMVIAGVCAAARDEAPFYAARDAAMRV
ncbi:MAG: phenylalanine--tRNA ligase subunit beta, partial [Planctomycetes bacterium]|nr:phenylalanine--tRNA ligase subunit beta [Planctomycetota bacterium]